MHVDTLLHARWVIPVEPPGLVLEQHSVAINEQRIAAILPTREAQDSIQATEEVRLPGHALLPGLINAHSHAAMNLLRGLADDLSLGDWLHKYIWPIEQRCVDANFVYDGTQLAIVEMLRGGISCFNDMYFFPNETARAASDCGMRAMVGLIVIDFPSAWAKDHDEYFKKGLAMRDAFKSNPLLHNALAPHAPYSVSEQPLRRVATLADELDLPIHTHVHETRDEVENSLQQFGKRPLQRLSELGLVNERLIAVHATQLDEGDIQLLAERGSHVAHCPESNLKLASGICPVQRLLEAGVNVCLGTDGAASNNDLDLLGELRTACLLAKGHSMDATAVSAATALSMVTINAARAMGLEQEIGSLKEGKSADIIALDMSWPETQPMYDPIAQLVYAANRRQVSEVWVAGRRRVQNGTVLDVDEAALLKKVTQWQHRIAAVAAEVGREATDS